CNTRHSSSATRQWRQKQRVWHNPSSRNTTCMHTRTVGKERERERARESPTHAHFRHNASQPTSSCTRTLFSPTQQTDAQPNTDCLSLTIRFDDPQKSSPAVGEAWRAPAPTPPVCCRSAATCLPHGTQTAGGRSHAESSLACQLPHSSSQASTARALENCCSSAGE
ncbi:unnamed protein product, partial [Ectocarpus fasciculatus]